MELIEYFGYNSVLILTFFFISFGALILKYVTLGASYYFHLIEVLYLIRLHM